MHLSTSPTPHRQESRHPLIETARAVNYWDDALTRLERLSISHRYRPALGARELAAMDRATAEAEHALSTYLDRAVAS